MKLAIVGSRTFTDWPRFCLLLQEFVDQHGLPDEVISGGAKGADTMAEKWARLKKIKPTVLRPSWRIKGVYNPRAGLDRNTDIVASCTHMIAFPSSKGSGTQDSIRKARKAGKILIQHDV